MPAFITPVVSILPCTRALVLGRCAVRKPRIGRTPVRAELADRPPTKDDDDDTDFGSNPAYGMVLPDLTPSDRAYLDGARSDKDFMRRMTEIAHRIDRNRHVESEKLGRQTADDYIENLSQRTREGTLEKAASPGRLRAASSPPPSTPQPDSEAAQPSVTDVSDEQDDEEQIRLMEESAQKLAREIADLTSSTPDEVAQVDASAGDAEPTAEQVDAQIAELQRKIMEAAGDSAPADAEDDEVPQTPEELADAARQLGDLQAQIRTEVGLADTPDSVSAQQASAPEQPQAAAGAKPGTIDKQIDYLERYVERLRKEAVEEGDDKKFAEGAQNAADDNNGDGADQGEAQGLMQELHDRATRTPEPSKPIPSAPDPDQKEGPDIVGLESKPGELSVDEKRAAFLELRRRAMAARGDMDGEEGLANDPFNVTLPKKQTSGREGDFSDTGLRRSDEEPLRADGRWHGHGEEESFVPRRAAAGDAPGGDVREFETFGEPLPGKQQLVEEIEKEVKAYVQQSRDLLTQHEARLNVMLSKLMASDGW